MNDRVTVSVERGVADVRLARGDKMNALDKAMFDALIETGDRLKVDNAVRAVVISGAGRAFCAGLDMSAFSQPADLGLASRSHGAANRAQYAVWVWREIPVPVIAAVHGVAFGGGFQLALGADIRIVAPDARMSVMEIKWGLVPDMAGTQLMRHLARDDVVRELTYTGRVFSGGEALALGFATRVSADPHGEALALAQEIAAKSPDAIRAAKRLLNAVVGPDLAAGFIHETAEQLALIGSPNQIEAVMANIQSRAPRFSDPDGSASVDAGVGIEPT